MKPLNILFVSPYIPSLIRVRPYNFIRALAERGHHLTLLALEPPGEDTSSLETLRRWCQYVETAPLPRWRTLWNGVQAIPSPTPFQAAYSRSPQMTELIERVQASRSFDVVHVEQTPKHLSICGELSHPSSLTQDGNRLGAGLEVTWLECAPQ